MLIDEMPFSFERRAADAVTAIDKTTKLEQSQHTYPSHSVGRNKLTIFSPLSNLIWDKGSSRNQVTHGEAIRNGLPYESLGCEDVGIARMGSSSCTLCTG